MDKGKELVLLFDTTGSQNYPIVPGSPVKRKDVLRDIVSAFVTKFSEADSQGGQEEGGGGIRTFTFAKRTQSGPTYRDLEDLNPMNFQEKWNSIQWGGQTYIMGGFQAMLQAVEEEFGDADPKPDVIGLIPTDGALEDAEAFIQALTHLPANITLEIPLIGHGDDNEGVFETYQAIAARSGGKLHVTNFQGHTDASAITQRLLTLV